MKNVVHMGLISTGLLFGTLLFATVCGIKASEIRSVQKKGYEKELLLSMSRPYKKYHIDSNHSTTRKVTYQKIQNDISSLI